MVKPCNDWTALQASEDRFRNDALPDFVHIYVLWYYIVIFVSDQYFWCNDTKAAKLYIIYLQTL